MTINTFLNNLSGRKVNRWLMTIILAGIGFALVFATWRWAYGAVLPDLPAQALILGAFPYIQQMWDNFVRTSEAKNAVAFQYGNAQPNTHGGPNAP